MTDQPLACRSIKRPCLMQHCWAFTKRLVSMTQIMTTSTPFSMPVRCPGLVRAMRLDDLELIEFSSSRIYLGSTTWPLFDAEIPTWPICGSLYLPLVASSVSALHCGELWRSYTASIFPRFLRIFASPGHGGNDWDVFDPQRGFESSAIIFHILPGFSNSCRIHCLRSFT